MTTSDPLDTALSAAVLRVEHALEHLSTRTADPKAPVAAKAACLVDLARMAKRLDKLADSLEPVHPLTVVPGDSAT